MSPAGLNAAQLQHAIDQFQTRVDAKKMEADALNVFCIECKDALAELLPDYYSLTHLQEAAENYFLAQRAMALIELEALELHIKMYKSQQSGIVGASGVILR